MYVKLVLHPPNQPRRKRQGLFKIFSIVKKFEETLGKKHTWHLEVSLINLIKGALVVGISYYLVVAYMGKVWLDHKLPNNEVPYTDVINPLAWNGIPKKIGAAHIEVAYNYLDSGNYQNALLRLRSGLMRNPEDLEARKTLAQFYLHIGMVELGLELMNQVWEKSAPITADYVSSQFEAAEYFHAFSYIQDLAETILAHPATLSEDPSIQESTILAAISASQSIHDYGSVLNWSDRWRDQLEPSAKETSARIVALYELEQLDEAQAEINDLSEDLASSLEVRTARIPVELAQIPSTDISIFTLTHPCWNSIDAWPIQLALIRELGRKGHLDNSLQALKFFANQPLPQEATIELYEALYQDSLVDQLATLSEAFANRRDTLGTISQRTYLNVLLKTDQIEAAKELYRTKSESILLGVDNPTIQNWLNLVLADEYPGSIQEEMTENLRQITPRMLRLSAKAFAEANRFDLAEATMAAALKQRPTDQSLIADFDFYSNSFSQVTNDALFAANERATTRNIEQSSLSDASEQIAQQRILNSSNSSEKAEAMARALITESEEKRNTTHSEDLARDRLEQLAQSRIDNDE